jgi:anti-sigma regulatory factor (Ser/Thr protein kinase)
MISFAGIRAAARRDLLTLPALPRTVPLSRAHVARVLDAWHLGPLAGDVALVVSELMTNAVRASAALPGAPPVHLGLAADGRRLIVAVADASPAVPVLLRSSSTAEGGRGLAVAVALAARWGWHPVACPGLAKAVWAEFPVIKGECAPRPPTEPQVRRARRDSRSHHQKSTQN